MSDQQAGRLGLLIVAVAAAGLLVFEWALAVDYLRQGPIAAAATMMALAFVSAVAFAWLAYDVWTSTESSSSRRPR